MIAYGFSIQGKGHIERGVVCQDSNKAGRIESGHYIGIVADGVGSAPHSDIGSDIAVKSLFQYCNDYITRSSARDVIEEILSDGYFYALSQVSEYAKNQRVVIEDFDTTLSAVVYDGETVVYGHAGDGGIIVKNLDGTIKPITSRQKGADGISVRPLRAGKSSWDFGVEKEVASVLLVTDGILDSVIQPVLVNLPADKMALVKGDFHKDNVYIAAGEFFMNPYSIYKNRNIKNPDEYMNYFLQGNLAGEDQEMFLKCLLMAYKKQLGKSNAENIVNHIKKYCYAVWAMKNITDDKSAVCIMNDSARVTPQSIHYYEEPDWKGRQERYNALLYGKPMQGMSPDKGKISSEYDTKKAYQDNLAATSGEIEDTRGRLWFFLEKGLGYLRKNSKVVFILLSFIIGLVFGAGVMCLTTSQPDSGVASTVPPKSLYQSRQQKDIAKRKESYITCARDFCSYLQTIDVSELSDDEKNEWRMAIKFYKFPDCIDIFDENKKNEKKDEDQTESSNKNGEIAKMINIMEDVFQNKEIEVFKKQLELTYREFNEKGKKEIEKNVNGLLQEDMPISKHQNKKSIPDDLPISSNY